MLSISHNLKQDECKNAFGGDGSNEPTPLPHAEDALPVNQPAES